MSPHLYQVGQPYIPGRTRWPEAVEYAYRGGGHELRLFFPQPNSQEKQDIKRGFAEFALVVQPPVILLLFRFGQNIPWSDAPFSIHMEKDQEAPQALGPDERSLLTVVLVNAGTGILEAIRVVSLSHEFSTTLHAAIVAQFAAPFDQATYDQALRTIYASAPQTTKLLGRSVARCRAGE